MNNKDEFVNLIGNRRIVLYGAGNLGKTISGILKKHGIRIVYFLDTNANNILPFGDVPIFTLESEPIEDKTNCAVIVSAFNRDFDFCKIKDNLLLHEYSHVFSFIDFYKYFYEDLGDYFWLTPNPQKLLVKEITEHVKSLFADEKSKINFELTVRARNEFNCELLPKPEPIREQYFSKDIPLHKASVFIDCGAFDGDTIDLIKEYLPTIQHIIAFEPDIQNYKKLSLKAQNIYINNFQSFISFPCGCWSVTKLLKFNSDLGEGSAVKENGQIFIQGIALDDAIINIRPDYIKMDIEGAEYDALLGSKNLIFKYQPDLAICVYHRPQDIINIISLIKGWNLNYQFYLRQYGFFGLDQVLYAIQEINK
jgi:FkbM family methyltransferase